MSEAVPQSATEIDTKTENIYKHAHVTQKLEQQRARFGRTFALSSDVDNTFRKKENDPEQDARSKSDTFKVGELAQEVAMPIILVTGNAADEIVRRADSGEIPHPDVIVGATGTEIAVRQQDGSYKQDTSYEASLRSGYDRRTIARKAVELITNADTRYPEWQLDFQHPDSEKDFLDNVNTVVQPFKTSFYFFADNPERYSQVITEFEELFPGTKLAFCEEIGYNQSHPQEANKKYCADVLAEDKSGVVAKLQKELGIDFMAVAGDSGNDATMLTGSGELAIAVNGAKPELQRVITEQISGARGIKIKRVIQDGKEKLYFPDYQMSGGMPGPASLLRAGQIFARLMSRFRS